MQFSPAWYEGEGCMDFQDTDVDFFQLDLFPAFYTDFLFTDGYDTDNAKFEKLKLQNCQIEV